MYENFKIYYNESLIYLTCDLIAQSNITNKKENSKMFIRNAKDI